MGYLPPNVYPRSRVVRFGQTSCLNQGYSWVKHVDVFILGLYKMKEMPTLNQVKPAA